jgi:hypothetical protein
MDWNHQGVWAIGAAVAGGAFGILGSSIATTSSENLASLSYAERINTAEIQIDGMADTLAGLRSEIENQSVALAASPGDAVSPQVLARIVDLEAQLKAVQGQLGATGGAPTAAEVAAVMVKDHADKLRGVQGEQGEPGPRGEAGPQGVPGVDGLGGLAGENGTAPSIDQIVAMVLAQVQKGSPSQQSAAGAAVPNGAASAATGEIAAVGPTDCLELDINQSVTVADFKAGGSACLNGIPIFQISQTNGCTAYFAHEAAPNTSVRPGVQFAFETVPRPLGMTFSCDRDVQDEAGNLTYRMRLFWK